MWKPASSRKSSLAFLMAAGIAFLGSATLLKAGRTFPVLAGGTPGGAQPGILLMVVVILLAMVGVLLVAMAGKEVLDDHRRRRHLRRSAP
jgi:hypothetical protein